MEGPFSFCTRIGLLRLFALSWSHPVLFLYRNCCSLFAAGCYWGLELGIPDKTGWKVLSEHQLHFPRRRLPAFSLLSALSVHLSYSSISAGRHTPFTPSLKMT